MTNTVVLGSINMDMVLYTDRVPNKGETVIGKEFETFTGGKGANQAVAICRQGGDVSMIAKLGNDKFGDKLNKSLIDNNINVTNIKKDNGISSGIALVLVENDGQNRIVVISGANGKLSPEDVISAEASLNDCSYLVMQFEVPIKTIEFAAALAKKKNIKTVLNASPLPSDPLSDELLQRIDFLVVNEIEAEGISGIPVLDVDSGKKAASTLQKLTDGTILLTLGENGSITAVNNEVWYNPPFIVESIDSTGAGDAFIGGFIGCLQKGYSLRKAVIHANAAGALATRFAGAQTSLPTYQETETFIKNNIGYIDSVNV